MHCGDCDSIPFWRWLKGNQTFPTSITCIDYDGEKLSNLQPNNFTDCFSEYLCTFFKFKSSNALLDTGDVPQGSNSQRCSAYLRIAEPSQLKGCQYRKRTTVVIYPCRGSLEC